MAVNVGAVLDLAKAIATHQSTKDTGLASLIVFSLMGASLAGVAIPAWAPAAASVVGVVIYKLLPKKYEDEIDAIEQELIAEAIKVPQMQSDPSAFPEKNDGAPPSNTSNINKPGGT